MKKDIFKDFLENKVKTSTVEEFNWDKQKEDWLNYLKLFYDEVNTWLECYIAEGLITCKFEKKSITEEYIGTYTVEKMILTLAGEKVVFDPVGTLLIGTKGRIDLVGRKTIVFLLINKNNKGIDVNFTIRDENNTQSVNIPKKVKNTDEPIWEWKILDRSLGTIQYQDFNKELFLKSLMKVANE